MKFSERLKCEIDCIVGQRYSILLNTVVCLILASRLEANLVLSCIHVYTEMVCTLLHSFYQSTIDHRYMIDFGQGRVEVMDVVNERLAML